MSEEAKKTYRGIPARAKPLTAREMLAQMSYRRGPQPDDVVRQIRAAEEARKRKAADSKTWVEQVADGSK